MGSRQITVNSVAPGQQKWQMHLVKTFAKKWVSFKSFRWATRYRKCGEFPDKAGYITGTVLHVNGGLYNADV